MAHRKQSPAAKPPPPAVTAHADRLRPWLLGAMTALFVARPLFPSESVAARGDGLPVVMLWIVLAAIWMLGAIRRRQFHVRFGWTDAAVGLLIAWHTIAAVRAARHLSARPAVNMLWEWIGMGLAFFLARQLISGRREARAVVAVMVALAVALSGYGLYQYTWEMPNTRAAYASDPEGAMRAAGLWFEPGSPERQLFETRLASPEPIATFALTNSLAGYLAPWMVVLVGIGASTLENRPLRRRIWPIVATWLAVVCGGTLIACCLRLTNSRSGWVATILGLLLVSLLLVRMLGRELAGQAGWRIRGAGALRGATLIAAAVSLAGAIVVAAAIATRAFDAKTLSGAGKSLSYRTQYWRSTLRMIAKSPLLGCGPGNFQRAYMAYKLPEASEEVADPHNFLLEVWATAGTPAMLAMLAMLGCFCRSIGPFRIATEAKDKTDPEDEPGDSARSHAPRNDESGNSPRISGVPPPGADLSQTPKGAAAASNPFAADAQIDSPGHVVAGAVCGFLLSLPLGWMSSAPPGDAAVWLGLPLAVGCMALLWAWIHQGRLPTLLPPIGVAVLLVNLLAAGGIGFPGVAASLWLLAALALRGDRPRTPPRSVALVGLIVALALAVACHRTGYGPVLRSRNKMELARKNPTAAESYLREAARADRLSAKPRRQLAALALEGWRRAVGPQRPAQFARFEKFNRAALELAPNSAPMWVLAGDQYLDAYAQTRRQRDIQEATRAYHKAVRLYPNSGVYRAKLALALKAAGDQVGFRQQADLALRLDRLTPHADKKLPEALRRRLLPKTRDGRPAGPPPPGTQQSRPRSEVRA